MWRFQGDDTGSYSRLPNYVTGPGGAGNSSDSISELFEVNLSLRDLKLGVPWLEDRVKTRMSSSRNGYNIYAPPQHRVRSLSPVVYLILGLRQIESLEVQPLKDCHSHIYPAKYLLL